MLSNKILAAMCNSRSAFELAYPHLTEKELGLQGEIVAKHIAGYYERDPEAETVDYELLLSSIARTLVNPKHVEQFKLIVERIKELEVSDDNVVHHVLDSKRNSVGLDLSAALSMGDKGRIPDLIEQYVSLEEATTIAEEGVSYHNIKVEDLINNHLSPDEKLMIAPKALNDRLNGGLLPGQHLVVFARPELGKSAMCCTMVWGFLQQNKRVLYLTN